MNVALTGLALEKFTKENKDKSKADKQYVRLFQVGEKVNTDVMVSTATFNKVKVGEKVTIPNVHIGVYDFNGNVGMYAYEEF
ncbi:MAG: hypothetical protein FH761_19320 [Firmicutes bacterium]|nr:hypothetical protein [Bacillota bacterium]